MQGFHAGEEQCGGAVDRGVHGSADPAPFTAFMGQQRFEMQLAFVHLGVPLGRDSGYERCLPGTEGLRDGEKITGGGGEILCFDWSGISVVWK
ncbi:hypothetical protein D9M73_285330 [compost metagenome]